MLTPLRYVLICLLPVCLSADVMLDDLHSYEGRWVGNFTIHSTATGYTENFPVEQRYWMEGQKLHGLAVIQRDAGMESTSSVTYVDGEKLVSEVKRGQTKDIYYGLRHEGGIVWLPSDMNRANDYQLKETIVEAGEKRILRTEGFDTYVSAGGLSHIVYRGELIWQGIDD